MSVVWFSTGRREGNARAPGALHRILRQRRLPANAATAEQVHHNRIKIVRSRRDATRHLSVDGLITSLPNQPLGIFTADCAPIFLSADQGRVVGMLHAGWRGVRSEILKKAVQLLKKQWKIPPRAIRVWLGPMIGSCCFEVRWDVARFFPRTRRRKGSSDRWIVDLPKELATQARRLGVRFEGQKARLPCTMEDRRFHSYRRNATSDRQVSVILRKDR